MSDSGRCLASVRVLPLHTPYLVRDKHEGLIRESWGRYAFANARRDPGSVRVLVGHDEGLEVARLCSLMVFRDWLHGDFVFDAELADVIVPGVGVSVGVERIEEPGAGRPSGLRLRETGLLREISLTRKPAVPGAVVRSVTRMRPEPEPTVIREPARPWRGEVIYDSPGTILIRPCGTILGIR